MCGKDKKKKKKKEPKVQVSVPLMFLPHYNIFCDLFYWTDTWQYGIY